ncbi:MAG: hypothetical protein U0Q16_07555 [Bryobacteraceae bacterium]
MTQRGGSATLQAPAITAPVSAQTIRTRSVTFSWSAVTGAAGYDIRVSGGRISEWAGTYILSTALVFQGSQMGAGATSTTIDLRYHSYRFFVRACSGPPSDATCGPFGTVDFNVVLAAPSQAPVIVSPLNGQAFSSSTQEFRWQPLPGVDSYQVTLTDSSAHAEMQIQHARRIHNLFDERIAHLYVERERMQAICGPSTQVIFSANLPPVPTYAPAVTTATPLVNSAHHRIELEHRLRPTSTASALVNPTPGCGSGALGSLHPSRRPHRHPHRPARTRQRHRRRLHRPWLRTLLRSINPGGAAPSTPVIGQPISVTNVDGPIVLFTWSRIPGDNGSNTNYRLYSADLSRSATALDVITKNNFYAALFAAEGRRYDAVVAANPGTSQTVSAPVGFIVQGTSSTAPTPTAPTHEGTVRAGNVEVGWTPVPRATFYQYAVYKVGDATPTATGLTPGLLALVPIAAQGTATRYSLILRACTAFTCQPDSSFGWGPWSNAPGGPGVTNFTVVP